jgi:hypothetical protein
MNCPACTDQRLHQPVDWERHPFRGHGFNGNIWTHPDLSGSAGAASLGQISGEVSAVKTAPAGEKE